MRAETPELWLAFGGGLLISLAATIHLLLKGRITGMSGLLSGVLGDEGSQWKISLLFGMGITSCVFWLIFGFDAFNEGKSYIFSPPAVTIAGLDLFGFALAGLLIGAGSRLAKGCTSGHGVCGLPRLSVRSYIASFLFVVFGLSLATLRYNNPFLSSTDGLNVTLKINYDLVVPLILAALVVAYLGYVFYIKRTYEVFDSSELVISFIVGVIFASGLIVSGLIKREKVLGFLSISEEWDPSLLIVLAAAVIPNFITFYVILRRPKPVLNQIFEVSNNKQIDVSLIAGSILFGLGWGLGGIIPGPAFVLAPIFTPHVSVIFLLALLTGYYLVMKLEKKAPQYQQTFTPDGQVIYVSSLQQSNAVSQSQFDLSTSVNKRR